MKDNEVGGACGTHGRGEKRVQGFGGKARGRDHLKDQGVDGRMQSKWTLGRLIGGGGVEWIHLARDRNRCQAVVNAVMNLQVVAPQS
jgi:hypothetical protein